VLAVEIKRMPLILVVICEAYGSNGLQLHLDRETFMHAASADLQTAHGYVLVPPLPGQRVVHALQARPWRSPSRVP